MGRPRGTVGPSTGISICLVREPDVESLKAPKFFLVVAPEMYPPGQMWLIALYFLGFVHAVLAENLPARSSIQARAELPDLYEASVAELQVS